MKELDTLNDLSDASLVMNKIVMKVIVQKLEECDNDDDFRHLIVHSFNSLVTCIDTDRLPITGGMYINLLAIALDNKLDVVKMMADATTMMNAFEIELKRRLNATS